MNATTPEATPLLILFGLFIMMLMFGSLLSWVAAIAWLRMGGKSIPVEPRRPAPWGLIHFVAIFVLFVVIGAATIRTFDLYVFGPMIANAPEDQHDGLKMMGRMFSGSLSQIITMVVASIMIAITTRCTAADLGWTMKHIGYDIVVGIGASILFIPVIQIIMASLVYLLDQKYDHPLLEALNSGPALLMYCGAFFAAVIAAPITEEFLFRVILQGLLEANANKQFSWTRLILGNMAEVHSNAPTPITATEAISDATSPIAATSAEPPTVSTKTTVPIWPIFVSGTLFGLAHIEYGPSWFPLILMGFLLGYLYRCTHRIWPCWIVHIALNSISMIGFGLQLLSGNPISSIFTRWF